MHLQDVKLYIIKNLTSDLGLKPLQDDEACTLSEAT